MKTTAGIRCYVRAANAAAKADRGYIAYAVVEMDSLVSGTQYQVLTLRTALEMLDRRPEWAIVYLNAQAREQLYDTEQALEELGLVKREQPQLGCDYCTEGYKWVRVGLNAETMTKVPCTICNPQPTYQMCTRCTGHGTVWVGGEASGHDEECPVCKGTGNLAAVEPEVIVELVQCEQCGQELELSDPANYCHVDEDGTAHYICPECYAAQFEDPDNPGPPPGTIEGPEEPEPPLEDALCSECGQPLGYHGSIGYVPHTHTQQDIEEQVERAAGIAAQEGLEAQILGQRAEALPEVVECPQCLFQHLQDEDCPVCTGNWPVALQRSQERAWRSEGQHPYVMRSLASVTRQGHREIRMECPVCGRLRYVGAEEHSLQLAKGLEYVCTGTRQLWQVVGWNEGPATLESSLQIPPADVVQAGGFQPLPLPADVQAQIAALEAEPDYLTEEQYQQMLTNTAQWAAQLEEIRAPGPAQRLPEPDRAAPPLRQVEAVAEIMWNGPEAMEPGWSVQVWLRGLPGQESEGGYQERSQALEYAFRYAQEQGAGSLTIRISGGTK